MLGRTERVAAIVELIFCRSVRLAFVDMQNQGMLWYAVHRISSGELFLLADLHRISGKRSFGLRDVRSRSSLFL